MSYKNIFLFGAGASHGCKGINHDPPLGSQLYDILSEIFSQTWGKIPDSLKGDFRNNFEYGMSKIWKDNNLSMMTPILMQNMAVYFSKLDITNINANLYAKIINDIKFKNIIKGTLVSTLNYDCLFELATSKLGIAYDYSNQENGNLKILKLHGSCNFKVKNIEMRRNAHYGSVVKFGVGFMEIEAIQPYQVTATYSGDTNLYPVMAIYAKNKPIQFAPTFIENLQKYWQTQVSTAEKIFIIGANPNLEDQHIWECLSQTKAVIYFCGERKAFDAWQKQSNRADTYLSAYFEDALEGIIASL